MLGVSCWKFLLENGAECTAWCPPFLHISFLLQWRSLLSFLPLCFCLLKWLFPVRFVCLEGMSKKFAETKMSIKYKKSLEVSEICCAHPEQSNEALPLRCLNQLINPYYINYDDEKLIIAFWPKNKCEWMREIFKAGGHSPKICWRFQALLTWVVTAGKKKTLIFGAIFKGNEKIVSILLVTKGFVSLHETFIQDFHNFCLCVTFMSSSNVLINLYFYKHISQKKKLQYWTTHICLEHLQISVSGELHVYSFRQDWQCCGD